MIDDPDKKISRPRQIYTGAREANYIPIAERPVATPFPVCPPPGPAPEKRRLNFVHPGTVGLGPAGKGRMSGCPDVLA